MKLFGPLVTLFALAPAFAWANPVHSVWANRPLYVSEPGAHHTATSADCAFSWNEATTQAFARARAKNSLGDVYEFQLVSLADAASASALYGYWNVTKNGVPLCTHCLGSAYGLNAPVGNYFKIYVQDSNYHLSAYITNRYDF